MPTQLPVRAAPCCYLCAPDATLSRKPDVNWQTLIDIARSSWGLLPLLVLVFIAGLTVIFERLYFFRRAVHAGLTLEYDLQKVGIRQTDAGRQVAQHYSGTVQAEVVTAALARAGASEPSLDRHLEEAIMFQMPKLDRNLWVLDTCVTLGPLLGLLGTIVHMIEAFSVLAATRVQGAGSVTAPIAHALVATAAGLVVAIVCVVFLNYFNKRIRLVVNQLDLIKSMLIGRFAAEAAREAA